MFIDQVHVHFPGVRIPLQFWHRKCIEAAEGSCDSEVRMRFIRVDTAKTSADVMSGILNCVCPECGGSMGEAGRVQVPG